MAAAGKKGKKAKWIATSITHIIAQPTTMTTAQNWADSVDEEAETYGYGNRARAPVVLPSASRAARGGLAVDDESIPKRPPYVAYISNLPYDVDESAITELFAGLTIQNLRLPREGDRLKGYGYVDFEDRESLINAMNIADLTIAGRRIRIDVSTNDNDRRMGNRGRSDRDSREYDPERTSGDWRSGPRAMPEPTRGRTSDRDITRERERDPEAMAADNRPGGWRDGDRPAAQESARTPYGGRDSFGRDRDRNDDRDRDRERGYGRDGFRDGGERGYGGRDGFRTADRDRDRDRGFSSREGNRGFGERRGFGDRDRERDPPSGEPGKPRERPKLNLLPRTVPRDADADGATGATAESVFGAAKPVDTAAKEREIEERLRKQAEEPPPKPASAESVFGAAKPVDTAAKEREIEERLRKQQEGESRRTGDERDRWGRKNDHSGERRAGARRDEPRGGSKDSRGYTRDKRDYSKDDKDRRDYRDDRDRRDYSKDDKDRHDRDRRDYSKDDKDKHDSDRRDYSKDRHDSDRRDYSKDDKDTHDSDRRDYSKDDKDTRDYSDVRDKRDNSKDGKDRDSSRDRDGSDRDRDDSRKRRDAERDKDADNHKDKEQGEGAERNGKDEDRPCRSRDRSDEREEREERPMPKLKEQEPPNFIGSNKFSFLEEADDGPE